MDFEALDPTGHIVRVRQWADGWQDGDAPALDDVEIDKAIMYHLMDCEKHGFTVEMCDATHGRALRGRTDRVDFIQEADGWHVKKYPHGWTAKTKPTKSQNHDPGRSRPRPAVVPGQRVERPHVARRCPGIQRRSPPGP